MYWPWPPMLNIPQRNAKATASAVRMIGVVKRSVCCRFEAATELVSHGNHMWLGRERDPRGVVADLEEPAEPRAGEDRVVDADGALAGERHDEAAHEEGEDAS